MKKNSYTWLILLLISWSLASCKKDEPKLDVEPKLQIVFDDAIDKVTADYKVGSMLTLKINANGASTVNIVSNYATGTAKTANLGSFPVTNGVATVVIPANSLRASGDGAPVGAGSTPVSSRAANTYTLTVEAVAGDVKERRFFTAVLVQ